MRDMKELLELLEKFHPEFAVKIGRKSGLCMVEVGIGGQIPATEIDKDMEAACAKACLKAQRQFTLGLVATARLQEAEFDAAVGELEDEPRCCSGCCSECDEDYDDNF